MVKIQPTGPVVRATRHSHSNSLPALGKFQGNVGIRIDTNVGSSPSDSVSNTVPSLSGHGNSTNVNNGNGKQHPSPLSLPAASPKETMSPLFISHDKFSFTPPISPSVADSNDNGYRSSKLDILENSSFDYRKHSFIAHESSFDDNNITKLLSRSAPTPSPINQAMEFSDSMTNPQLLSSLNSSVSLDSPTSNGTILYESIYYSRDFDHSALPPSVSDKRLSSNETGISIDSQSPYSTISKSSDYNKPVYGNQNINLDNSLGSQQHLEVPDIRLGSNIDSNGRYIHGSTSSSHDTVFYNNVVGNVSLNHHENDPVSGYLMKASPNLTINLKDGNVGSSQLSESGNNNSPTYQDPLYQSYDFFACDQNGGPQMFTPSASTRNTSAEHSLKDTDNCRYASAYEITPPASPPHDSYALTNYNSGHMYSEDKLSAALRSNEATINSKGKKAHRSGKEKGKSVKVVIDYSTNVDKVNNSNELVSYNSILNYSTLASGATNNTNLPKRGRPPKKTRQNTDTPEYALSTDGNRDDANNVGYLSSGQSNYNGVDSYTSVNQAIMDGKLDPDDSGISVIISRIASTATKSSTAGGYICPFANCKKTIKYRWGLKSHIQIHFGERKHICQVCGAGFMRRNDMQRHIKRHTGDRPHVCNVCGRKFSRSDALKKHKALEEMDHKLGKRGKQSASAASTDEVKNDAERSNTDGSGSKKKVKSKLPTLKNLSKDVAFANQNIADNSSNSPSVEQSRRMNGNYNSRSISGVGYNNSAQLYPILEYGSQSATSHQLIYDNAIPTNACNVGNLNMGSKYYTIDNLEDITRNNVNLGFYQGRNHGGSSTTEYGEFNLDNSKSQIDNSKSGSPIPYQREPHIPNPKPADSSRGCEAPFVTLNDGENANSSPNDFQLYNINW